MAYSMDLRERAVKYCLEKNHTQSETAQVFGVSVSALKRWMEKQKNTGSMADRKRIRKQYKYSPEKIIEIIRNNPDAYLYEIAEQFENGSVTGVKSALDRMGITRKKRRQGTGNETKKNARNS
jgi:transposase